MKTKWSKVPWSMEKNLPVQNFEMAELLPKGTKRPEQEEEDKDKDKDKDRSHDCSALQKRAFEQGRQKGSEEGRVQCQAQVDEEFKRALQLANQIGSARVAALEERDRDIVEVALLISQKIILRELEIDKEFVVRQVRKILGQLNRKGIVTLKLNPQDLAVLEPFQQALQAEFVDGNHLVLEPDENLQPGGCLVEQAGLQLDARLEQQLETVATEFGLETSHS